VCLEEGFDMWLHQQPAKQRSTWWKMRLLMSLFTDVHKGMPTKKAVLVWVHLKLCGSCPWLRQKQSTVLPAAEWFRRHCQSTYCSNFSSSLIAGFYDYRYNFNHITKPYMASTPIRLLRTHCWCNFWGSWILCQCWLQSS
jgi:antibiotic biosynthesis monooxygenase (ABM) superfamily enzyme